MSIFCKRMAKLLKYENCVCFFRFLSWRVWEKKIRFRSVLLLRKRRSKSMRVIGLSMGKRTRCFGTCFDFCIFRSALIDALLPFAIDGDNSSSSSSSSNKSSVSRRRPSQTVRKIGNYNTKFQKHIQIWKVWRATETRLRAMAIGAFSRLLRSTDAASQVGWFSLFDWIRIGLICFSAHCTFKWQCCSSVKPLFLSCFLYMYFSSIDRIKSLLRVVTHESPPSVAEMAQVRLLFLFSTKRFVFLNKQNKVQSSVAALHAARLEIGTLESLLP